MKNAVKMEIVSFPQNVAFARQAAASFILPFDPTVETLADVKTAVSEAVTNAVVHAYRGTVGKIQIFMESDEKNFYITISDKGVGIRDVSKALTPMYTSRPEDERSGLGFTIMESLMDSLTVSSKAGAGTEVKMIKSIL